MTVYDLSAVGNMTLDDSESKEASGYYAQSVSDDGDDQDSDLAFLRMEHTAEVKK